MPVGGNYLILQNIAFPSHGRGRRFNPYSAHQQIKILSNPTENAPPETRDSLRSEYRPGNKKGPARTKPSRIGI